MTATLPLPHALFAEEPRCAGGFAAARAALPRGLVVGLATCTFVRPERDCGARRVGAPLLAQAGRHRRGRRLGLLVIGALAWLVAARAAVDVFGRRGAVLLHGARHTAAAAQLQAAAVAARHADQLGDYHARDAANHAGHSWMTVVGLWWIFMTVRLHLTGVALRRSSLTQHGKSGLSHQWIPLVVVFGAGGVLIQTVVNAWPTIVARRRGGRLRRSEATVRDRSRRHRALAIPRADGAPALVVACRICFRAPWVLALIAVNYLWVLRSDASFEEASAEQAERQHSRSRPRERSSAEQQLRRSRGSRGPPETAILWKNLILLGRYVSARLLACSPLSSSSGSRVQGSGRAGARLSRRSDRSRRCSC